MPNIPNIRDIYIKKTGNVMLVYDDNSVKEFIYDEMIKICKFPEGLPNAGELSIWKIGEVSI